MESFTAILEVDCMATSQCRKGRSGRDIVLNGDTAGHQKHGNPTSIRSCWSNPKSSPAASAADASRTSHPGAKAQPAGHARIDRVGASEKSSGYFAFS
jgi:hypothetical protein